MAALLLTYAAGPGWAGTLVGTVTVRGRAVRQAVLFVEELREPPVSKRAVMDQRNRTFLPHVMAVQTGTRVEFPNNDTIFHNVFSTREGKPFDLGLYPVGKTQAVQFRQPGLIRLSCNIPSNMSAFIWVVDNPYFAVTDRSGRFRIPRVPGGARGVQVWHERLGTRRVQVGVPEGGEVSISIKLESR